MRTTFAGMFREAQRLRPGADQYTEILERSSEALGEGSVGIRSVHDLPQPPQAGRYVLIGAAVYSLHELELLDAIVKKRRRHDDPEERLEVLDILTCRQNDFEEVIPGIGEVLATPVFGIWEDGILKEKAWGHKAVQAIKHHYSFA
jgi:hypothetical protein